MKKEVIKPKGMYDPSWRGFCHAIKVGNTVYVAGQASFDEERNVVGVGDCTAQATQVFENIKKILEATGASLRDVVRMTYYVTSREDMEKVRAVRFKYFSEYMPASTGLVVASLSTPELLVEIEVTAVI